MNLKEKVVVVSLNISQWTARKKDVSVTREVEEAHGATDSGNFNKALISKDVVPVGNSSKEVELNPLKAIGKLAGAVRTYHYKNTSPWSDNGDRILSAKNYFNYLTEMGKFRKDFDALVDDFLVHYPALIAEARRRLNTMFKEEDYPDAGRIRDKFRFSYSFMPIGDVDDIRVSIGDDEIRRVREEVASELNARVQTALNDLLGRIRDAVGHMAETLTGTTKTAKGTIKEAIFRDSLVGNICELIELAPLMNFADDPHIDEVVELIRPLCVDPELLRTEPEVRREIAERAAAVLPLI